MKIHGYYKLWFSDNKGQTVFLNKPVNLRFAELDIEELLGNLVVGNVLEIEYVHKSFLRKIQPICKRQPMRINLVVQSSKNRVFLFHKDCLIAHERYVHIVRGLINENPRTYFDFNSFIG